METVRKWYWPVVGTALAVAYLVGFYQSIEDRRVVEAARISVDALPIVCRRRLDNGDAFGGARDGCFDYFERISRVEAWGDL